MAFRLTQPANHRLLRYPAGLESFNESAQQPPPQICNRSLPRPAPWNSTSTSTTRSLLLALLLPPPPPPPSRGRTLTLPASASPLATRGKLKMVWRQFVSS
jgi:hypothetical protein